MQKKNKKISARHRIEYLAFMGVVTALKLSPLFLAGFNRRVLQFLFSKLNKRHHRLVKKNLDIAFPNKTREEIETLRQAIYTHFSSVFLEIIYLFVKRKPGKILKPIEVVNLRFLEDALEKKKGVIVFSGHFGNWELIPYILSRELDRPVNSIARKMDNPLVEKKVKQFREFMGSALIYKQNSIRTILNRLNKNGIVYLLIDQHTIKREAVTVEFFKEPVWAVPSVSQLHIRKDIPALPVFIHYDRDRIVLEIMEEITFTRSDDQAGDIRRLTQQCITLIEEKINRHPEQWFWFHDRWKNRLDPTAETT
jgi:KDO2-lipid IV(A) lauroyltransferase